MDIIILPTITVLMEDNGEEGEMGEAARALGDHSKVACRTGKLVEKGGFQPRQRKMQKLKDFSSEDHHGVRCEGQEVAQWVKGE